MKRFALLGHLLFYLDVLLMTVSKDVFFEVKEAAADADHTFRPLHFWLFDVCPEEVPAVYLQDRD